MIGSRSIALTLVMALNRRIHRAYNRMRDGNFSIDGLLGLTFMERQSESLASEKSAASWLDLALHPSIRYRESALVLFGDALDVSDDFRLGERRV